jgi:hypothetical protein
MILMNFLVCSLNISSDIIGCFGELFKWPVADVHIWPIEVTSLKFTSS